MNAHSTELPPALRALQHLVAGDWEGAHKILQNDLSRDAAWVHAHVHRVEGDLSNARYWYARAGRAECTDSLETERREMMRALNP